MDAPRLSNVNPPLARGLASFNRQLSAPCPAHHLPSEVLFQIFESLSGDSLVRSNETHDVWRCAQVCGRWRAILCEAMPWLWCSIGVDVDTLRNVDGVNNILHHYLKRSHGRPLSITLKRCIRSALNCDASSSKKLKDCLEQLISHSARWQDFSCHGLFAHELEYLAPIKGRLPILRHLHLYIHDDFIHEYTDDMDMFRDAPKLQSVKILGTHLTRAPLALPWTQLVSYQANQSHRHLIDVLRKASDMESCLISSRPSIHDPYNGPSISHDKLVTLSVHGTHILSSLSLPSLHNLTITLNCPPELAALTSFLKNSRTPLRELKLTGHCRFPNRGNDFSDLLKGLLIATPSLTSLDFGLLLPHASNMLYALLTVECPNGSVLPELQSLTVHPSLLEDQSETLLLAMIASRYRAPLRALRVNLGDRVIREPVSMGRLEKLSGDELKMNCANRPC
ncbi:hypothetical protein L218DRAFT_1001739 [Marasmius fiardii PR-910]|nr:hypothetical protein L218DRAFT_1001739 [Marasmius fiardii PR-910]